MASSVVSTTVRRLALSSLLALAATGAFATPALAAPAPVATESMGFTADARGSVWAWSGYDPAVRGFRLRLSVRGMTVTPALAPRSRPFDVDLGPLAGGGTGAVYSRCTTEAARSGCDVYLYDLARGIERKVGGGVSTSAGSEFLPSLDGGRVAFVRSRGGRTRLYTGPTAGAGRVVRQPTPASGTIDQLELAHGRLLYVWDETRGLPFGRSSLFRTRGDRAIRMFSTESGGANESRLYSPAYVGGRVTFGERNTGSGTGNRLYRSTLGGRRLEEAPGSARWVGALPASGGRFLVADGYDECGDQGLRDGTARCALSVIDPPRWTPAQRRP